MVKGEEAEDDIDCGQHPERREGEKVMLSDCQTSDQLDSSHEKTCFVAIRY